MRVTFFKPASALSLLLIGALAFAACHKPPPQTAAAPEATGTPKAVDEASKELPNDLYRAMPIYPGSVVQHVRKPRGAMREIIFELKPPPSLDEMVNFYKDGLKKGEFRITSMLIMRARKTWSCDFQKEGRPGSIMLYPSDDKTATTIDLIYEIPSNVDASLLEPKEDFDVIGPGPPGEVTPVAEKGSQDKIQSKKKAKRD